MRHVMYIITPGTKLQAICSKNPSFFREHLFVLFSGRPAVTYIPKDDSEASVRTAALAEAAGDCLSAVIADIKTIH